MNRSILILITLFLIVNGCKQNTIRHDYPFRGVSIRNVKITDNFWKPRIIANRDITIPYAFGMCQKTGRIKNFIIAASRKKGQFCSQYPFDDSDVYKIIEGASYTLETYYDKSLDIYLDSLIQKIASAQEKDGYLETWRIINPDKPLAPWWGSAPRWSNLQSGHELYNLGHLYEAAVAYYQATGKKTLLNVAIKSADLICQVFGPGKMIGVPGHEEVEIGLMKLYRVTHDPKYLNLAKFFIDMRGDSTKRKTWGEYQQDQMPVREQREAVGHAVRAGYLYSAMTDLTALTGDTTMLPALNSIWNDIADHKLYITGGVGSRSEGEAFGNSYELPNSTAYAETCAAISMVLWNHRMFMLTGNSKYYDFLERTLYNGLISGVSLNGNSFFYENPLESSGDSTFNEGGTTRQPWFACACCPSNLTRIIPQIPGLIYAIRDKDIYVNLYISNNANISIGNDTVHLSMKSGMPYSGNTQITVNIPDQTELTLALRIPSWAQGRIINDRLYHMEGENLKNIKIQVNGKNVNYVMDEGYAMIARKWNKGDIVQINFDIEPEVIRADSQVASDRDKVALGFGPIIYCAEGIDNDHLGQLSLDNKTRLTAALYKGFGIPVVRIIATNPDHSHATFIPYSFWSNRGPSAMKVWINYKEL